MAVAVVLMSMPLAHLSRAAPAARGAIAGKIFDRRTKTWVADATVDAYALTSGEEFRARTDAAGTYVVDDAPTGVYAFSLRVRGTDYPVQERLDVRVGMPFVLESCFELDAETRTAHVRAECDTGFVEKARVATIGPHRFLRPPQEQPATQASAPLQPETTDELEPDGLDAEPEDGATEPDLFAEDSDIVPESSPGMPAAILHDELECLTYDHFPLVDANIAPGAMVQISRVYFRSDKYPDFYYVDMGPDNPTIDDFRAILPKPTRETERIYYYVESVDSEFNTLLSSTYDPDVLEVEACKDRGAAWFQGEEPGIVVGATQGGASAIPPGFQAAGITGFVSSLGVLTSVGGAAGGGVAASTTGLVLVVSGGAAAAAGTTVVVTGDKEASPPK